VEDARRVADDKPIAEWELEIWLKGVQSAREQKGTQSPRSDKGQRVKLVGPFQRSMSDIKREDEAPITGTVTSQGIDHGNEESMAILVVNAPKRTVHQENAKSFEKTFQSGIGDGYAISKNLFDQLSPCCVVVLLSKDQKLRAEGRLIKLVSTTKTKNGIQRYDVYIENIAIVPYRPERLNRNGIAVI
jgi:hypothetical protein